MKTLIAVSLILAFAAPAFAQDMEWKTDYKKALELAKEDGRPVIVHFWADW